MVPLKLKKNSVIKFFVIQMFLKTGRGGRAVTLPSSLSLHVLNSSRDRGLGRPSRGGLEVERSLHKRRDSASVGSNPV